MRVTVKLFGPQAQQVGRREVTVELGAARPTCAEVRTALQDAAPELATSLPGSWFAVNHAYVDEQHVIAADDEVALIGMVSGG